MNKQQDKNSDKTNIEEDLVASSRKHLVISEFNLVINYAPYLGIFVFPLKDNIFRNSNKIGTASFSYDQASTRMGFSGSSSPSLRTSQEKCPTSLSRITFFTHISIRKDNWI
jgi:hypothetical protein